MHYPLLGTFPSPPLNAGARPNQPASSSLRSLDELLPPSGRSGNEAGSDTDQSPEAIDGGIIFKAMAAASQPEYLDLPASLERLNDTAIFRCVADPIVRRGIETQFPSPVVRAHELGRDRIRAKRRPAETSRGLLQPVQCERRPAGKAAHEVWQH